MNGRGRVRTLRQKRAERRERRLRRKLGIEPVATFVFDPTKMIVSRDDFDRHVYGEWVPTILSPETISAIVPSKVVT